MQESKLEITQVVSFVKMMKNLQSVFSSLNWIEKEIYGNIKFYVPPPMGRGTHSFWCGSHWHQRLHCQYTFLSAQYLVKQCLVLNKFHGYVIGK